MKVLGNDEKYSVVYCTHWSTQIENNFPPNVTFHRKESVGSLLQDLEERERGRERETFLCLLPFSDLSY